MSTTLVLDTTATLAYMHGSLRSTAASALPPGWDIIQIR